MTEKQLHKQICDYLHLQYPKILFNTDMGGLKLTIGQAVQAKKLRSQNGFPDIVIYEKCKTDIFSALFLEVKKETPFKKNGVLKKNAHLLEQKKLHEKLRARGFSVYFVWTFEQAKNIIDNYLK